MGTVPIGVPLIRTAELQLSMSFSNLAVPAVGGRGAQFRFLQINDLLSIRRAVETGVGIAMLPDYLIEKDSGLVQLLAATEVPSFDTYFAYPEAMKDQAKLHAFRDFVIAKARSWSY